MRVPFALALLLMSLPASAKPRFKEMLQAFEAGRSEDRVRLAVPLGRTREKKAADALLIAFNPKGGNPKETTVLVEALGYSGDPRAVDALSGAWDYMRTMTMQLGELPPHLQVLRQRILEAYSRLGGERAVATLSEALNDKDGRIVEEAARGLGVLQVKDAVPALQRLAGEGETPNLRQTAIEALADIGDKRALSTLQPGLLSADKWVEVQSAYALTRLGQREALPHLEGALKTDPGTERVGILAAYYLAKLDKADGLKFLDALSAKTDNPAAVLAAEALGKCGNPRAAVVLVERASHPDSGVRIAAARGLGRLGGSRAVGALKKLARTDANAGVRNAAALALVDLGEAD